MDKVKGIGIFGLLVDAANVEPGSIQVWSTLSYRRMDFSILASKEWCCASHDIWGAKPSFCHYESYFHSKETHAESPSPIAELSFHSTKLLKGYLNRRDLEYNLWTL